MFHSEKSPTYFTREREENNDAALASQRSIQYIEINGQYKARLVIPAAADGNCGFTASRVCLILQGKEDLAKHFHRQAFIGLVKAIRQDAFQYERFKNDIINLLKADSATSLSEWENKFSSSGYWLQEAHFILLSKLFNIRFNFYYLPPDEAIFKPELSYETLFHGEEDAPAVTVSLAHVSTCFKEGKEAPLNHFDGLLIDPAPEQREKIIRFIESGEEKALSVHPPEASFLLPGISPPPLLDTPASSHAPFSQASTPSFPVPPASVLPQALSEGATFIDYQIGVANYAPAPQDKIGHLQFIKGTCDRINIGSHTINRAILEQEHDAQAESSGDLPLSSSFVPATVNFNHSSISAVHLHAALSSLPQKAPITWQVLIECVKQRYLKDDKIKMAFDEAKKIDQCYVNLAIVEEKALHVQTQSWGQGEMSREGWLNRYEQLHGVKTPILPEAIFTDKERELKRLLLLGRAGSGKSVLCQYLAYKWAKGELWQKHTFKLVIWVPLHELTNDYVYPKNGEAISLGKVLYELLKDHLHEVAEVKEEKQWIHALDELLRGHQADILYLLDGYDEVASLLNERKQSRQAQLIDTLLKKERVLITSRPYYIDHYVSSESLPIERRLENMGFTDDNVKNYIARYSWLNATQGKTLTNLLHQNANLRGITHILNLIHF